MKQWLLELRELILPTVCAGCGRSVEPATVLCPPCDAALPRFEIPGPTPPGLDACVAAAEYSAATELWIRRFKYPKPGLAGIDTAAGSVVRMLACEAAARAPGEPPALVLPVPLHPRRLAARGFNPAGLLARSVARAVRIPMDARALRRIHDTPTQTGLGAADRRRNVRGAFRAMRSLPHAIWLVDDVTTTGSTLSEIARVCRAAGARQIVALCAAATPGPRQAPGSTAGVQQATSPLPATNGSEKSFRSGLHRDASGRPAS